GAADFFLSFEQDGEVHGQVALLGEGLGEALHVGHELAFVVGGTAAVDAAIADGGLKGGGLPLAERFGGLHVVVAVEQDGFAVGAMDVLGNKNGVAGGLVQGGGEADG